MCRPSLARFDRRQLGATAVEFAIVALLFFTIIFGIFEFGRYFYVTNTLQEVTRRAAREQVVRWVSEVGDVQRRSVFSTATSGDIPLPAGAEVSSADVKLTFHNTLDDAYNLNSTGISIGGLGDKPQAGVDNCVLLRTDCIRYVRATLDAGGDQVINYVPTVPLFAFLSIPLPRTTVVVPAEAMLLQD